MPGGSLIYLFVAYTVVWVVLFGYMFFISQQIGDLRAQLDSLRRGQRLSPPSQASEHGDA
jgi:CcmD family protein